MDWYWILLIVIGSLFILFLLTLVLYKPFFKRFWDIVLSGLAIIVLSPILLFTTIGVFVSLGRPALFNSKRVTKKQRTFHLLKFRSMKNLFDDDGIPLPDEERITKFGRFIRKTSLDELPSLFNIFNGDMSIVGPRPMPLNYLPWFKEEERKRFTVRAGLTGLAQVSGRGCLDWEKKFQFDCEYVDKCSLFLDIKILFMTVFSVFKRSNIGVRGEDTPPDFHCYRSGLTEKELKDLENEDKLPKSYEEWNNEKTINA